ncbi:MAG: RICIN domain-containing protein [Lachnospiraceae bacterium]|nr:RICIN domain-containing protein [Lachnospiraceae bacterium]
MSRILFASAQEDALPQNVGSSLLLHPARRTQTKEKGNGALLSKDRSLFCHCISSCSRLRRSKSSLFIREAHDPAVRVGAEHRNAEHRAGQDVGGADAARDDRCARASSGTNVRQYTANGTAAQRWNLKPAEDGTFTLEPACAPGFCLDIAGASVKNGTNAHLYTANGTAAQRFSFEAVDEKRTAPNGLFTFTSALDETKVIDVAGGSVKNGANVQLYSSNGTAAQQFSLDYLGDGWYTILNAKAEKALDVAGGRVRSGANIQLYTPNQTSAQKWRFEDHGDGSFTVVSALGKVLDVAGAGTKNGTNIQTFTANGAKAQSFSFLPVLPAADPAPVHKHIVAIDPGHQRHGNSSLEPNAPGSSVMKAKVTSETEGLWSGLEEYVLNLSVGLKLRDELEARGYSVYNPHDPRRRPLERTARTDGRRGSRGDFHSYSCKQFRQCFSPGRHGLPADLRQPLSLCLRDCGLPAALPPARRGRMCRDRSPEPRDPGRG